MTKRTALGGNSYAEHAHVALSQCCMHRRGEASSETLPKATRRACKRVRVTSRFDDGEVAPCTAEASLRRVHCRRQPEGRASVCAATPRRGSLLHMMSTFISSANPFVKALRMYLDHVKTITSGSRQIYGKMCMSVLIVATLSAHVSIGDGYRWVSLPRNDASGTFRIGYQEFENTDHLKDETAYEPYEPQQYDVTIAGFATDTGLERGNVIVTTNLVIPAQLTYEVHKLSGDGRGKTDVELHTGWVRILQYECFRGSKKLLSVSIPSSIRHYGGLEFAECTALHSVTVGCHNISRSMFYGCASLKHIDLPNGIVKNISESAFSSSGLLDISIPGSVMNIGNSAFYQCTSMTSVVINAGVQSIGTQAFGYCSALKSVELPRNVKVGKESFKGCTGMTSLIMQSGTHVEIGAFRSCNGLKTIVVNNQGEDVGSTFFNGNSFSYCNGLESIRFEGNAPTIDGSVFRDVPSSCTVYVHRDSSGWGVDIPGTWKGLRIEYIESGSGGGSGGETPPVGESFDLGFYSGRTNYEDWRDSMFVTTTQGGTTPMTSIAQGAKIYLYYGFANLAGNFDMGGFVNRFTLSTGAAFEDNWSNSTLAAGQWGWGGKSYSPAALQNLAPGTYTLTCTLDATSKLSETNEGNNTKSITFTIVASDLDEGEYDPLVKIYCLVSFDPNGGDRVSIRVGGIESRYVLKGKTLGAYGDLPVPTRSGYTFVGWFTAADGGTRVTASTKVTGNVTYYAHWEKIGGDASSSGGGSATPVPSGGAGWTAKGARTLNGAMYDAAGNLAGVVQLKVARPNARKRTVKLSGYVVPLDGKKVALRADAAVAYTGAPLTVNATSRAFGAFTANIDDSGFSGKIGGYTIRTANVGGNWARTNAKVRVATTSFLTGTVEALLPNGEPVLAVGGRWAFNRAASVKLSKDKSRVEWDTSRGRTNLSGMKLTYTPKTGLFKGSFKVYVLEGVTVRKRLKKYTFNVTGVVVGGVGYGVATCKRPAVIWTVTVE